VAAVTRSTSQTNLYLLELGIDRQIVGSFLVKPKSHGTLSDTVITYGNSGRFFMWTDNAEDRALITDLTRQVVAEVDPDELSLFDDLLQEYFTESTPPVEREMIAGEEMGFGMGEMSSSTTPAAATLVTTVLNHLLTEALKLNPDETQEALKPKVKALFNGKSRIGTGPLPKEQVERTRSLIIKQAKSLGWATEEAKRAADTLLGSLTPSQ
jgi:hypothetical protein